MKPNEIGQALRLIAEAVREEPPAAMFALADAGYISLFQQLVGCVISIRTMEEVSLPASLRLLERAPGPAEMLELPAREIAEWIEPATFADQKAGTIREIARTAQAYPGGALPCDQDTVLGIRGIGPKCAALALGIACGLERVPVDIHVHRVTNRWGVVETRTPERTQLALEEILHGPDRLTINRLLVPFGKRVCTGRRPFCSTCPVRHLCSRVGVTSHR